MQAIFRLFEGDALRAFENLMGDLFTPVRRQTMHDHGIFFGQRDHPSIHLIGAKRM